MQGQYEKKKKKNRTFRAQLLLTYFRIGLLSLFKVATKGLFTWSGGPRSSGVGFFCFHALEDTKQKKLTQLDRGPPLHVTGSNCLRLISQECAIEINAC